MIEQGKEAICYSQKRSSLYSHKKTLHIHKEQVYIYNKVIKKNSIWQSGLTTIWQIHIIIFPDMSRKLFIFIAKSAKPQSKIFYKDKEIYKLYKQFHSFF